MGSIGLLLLATPPVRSGAMNAGYSTKSNRPRRESGPGCFRTALQMTTSFRTPDSTIAGTLKPFLERH